MPSLDELDELARDLLPRQLAIIRHASAQVLDSVRTYAELLAEQLNRYGAPLPESLVSALRGASDVASEMVAAARAPAGADPTPPAPHTPTHTPLPLPLTLPLRPILYTAAAAAAATVGLALARRFAQRPTRRLGALAPDGTRTEAALVVGADAPAGTAAVLALAARQLVVIATVRTPAAARALEARVPAPARAYVRALAVPPGDALAVRHAVHAALSLRYPLARAGDPFAPPGRGVRLLGIACAPQSAADADALVGAAESVAALARPHVVTLLVEHPAVMRHLRPALLRTRTRAPAVGWTAVYGKGGADAAADVAADVILRRTARVWATYAARAPLRTLWTRLVRGVRALLGI